MPPKKHPRFEKIEYYRDREYRHITVGQWANNLFKAIRRRDHLEDELRHAKALLESDVRAADAVFRALVPPASLSETTAAEQMRRVYLEQLPAYVRAAAEGRPERLRKMLEGLKVLQ